MENTTIIGTPPVVGATESSVSAVTWSAIFAGAFVAVAVSLALLVLGAGLGFASISPWSGAGAGIAAFGLGAAIWLVIMQWVASALGGYITGRLRTKWVGVHTDEVFFRDTAHGLLAWAVATIVMAALFASTAATLISGGTQAASTVVSGVAQGAGNAAGGAMSDMLNPTTYYVDRLFRPADGDAAAATAAPASADTSAAPSTTAAPATTDTAAAPSTTTAPAVGSQPMASANASAPAGAADMDAMRAETGRLLVRNLGATEFNAGDRTYLARIIAQQTGVEQTVAVQRIDEIVAEAQSATATAQAAADTARAAAAKFSITFFLSLLIGAFIAITAAAYGGRQRDDFDALVRVR